MVAMVALVALVALVAMVALVALVALVACFLILSLSASYGLHYKNIIKKGILFGDSKWRLY